MKLTEKQISIICRYTDGYRIDREKLISYIENHKTITKEVFDYSSKVHNKAPGSHGYCMYLEDEPMFTPVDRETFIRRIPFYFYQIQMSGDRHSGLSFIIPLEDDGYTKEDYEAFYTDLEWMLYDIGIPIEVIFSYTRDQVEPDNESVDESLGVLSRIKWPRSMYKEGSLNARILFRYWRHYLHMCEENSWTDLVPERLITEYNRALVKTGLKPIIYYPIKSYGSSFTKEDNTYVCSGHFPCDENGDPILEWTAISVKHPASITYRTTKSKCGELRIVLSPKTIIYILDEQSTKNGIDKHKQVYAGPQTMEFNNEALREYRRSRKMTQSSVAEAIDTTVRTYQKWESGETTPDGHYLIRLINWLNIDDVQSLIKYNDIPE